MRLTTILFWQVLLVLLAAICGVWSAGQWTAHALGYSAQLGDPWFHLMGEPVYAPWAFFGWRSGVSGCIRFDPTSPKPDIVVSTVFWWGYRRGLSPWFTIKYH